MSNMLLPHQTVIYNKVMTYINNNNVIISGPSGCGKTEVLKKIFADIKFKNKISVWLDTGKTKIDEKYYPFLYGLKEAQRDFTVDTITSTLSQDIPVLTNTVQLLHKWILGKAKKTLDFMNETEKELYDKLVSLNKKGGLAIFCDNIHYWDTESLSFFYKLFNNNYLYENLTKYTCFVVCFTTDQNCYNNEMINFMWSSKNFEQINFENISYNTFIKNLHLLGLEKELTQDEYKTLYHLIDGHIQVMLAVIQEINGERFTFNKSYKSNIELLKPILKKRLEEMGEIGFLIDEALKYASLIGIKFNSVELEKIFELLPDASISFNTTMKEAEGINLVKNAEYNQYFFVHEIIMQVFEADIPRICKDKYYLRLANCLQYVKPHDYLRRAYCLINALRKKDAERSFVLYLIQQFKNESEIANTTFDELKSYIFSLESYVNSMKQAYEKYHKKKYTSAYYILFAIPDIFAEELLAEKYILVSCCHTKMLDAPSKKNAVNCLLKFSDSENIKNERDVYENVLERLMICYIHSGNIKKARDYEELFIKSIASRIEYDFYAKYRLYKLYRKANALYDTELAIIKMKQSVSYFATNSFPSNVKDLYIALTNMSCVLIDNGEFYEAYVTALRGINLESEFPHLNFPRTQIIRSNFCIAGVLSFQLTLDNAISGIENILNNIPVIPERIFHATNLSTLYAMNNNLIKALEIINTESSRQNYQDDLEGLYKYFIYYNKIVFNYLSNNSCDISDLVTKLDDMYPQIIIMLDGYYYAKKNALLIEIIKSKKIFDTTEWLHIFQKQETIYQNKSIWKFIGLGYAFVSMNNWE